MFRSMRSKKKEITPDQITKLLVEERRGVLSVNGDDEYPYGVPVSYFYDPDNQTIYFHGAFAGYKAEALKRCDKVCFTVYGNETIKDLEWAPYMQSVIAFGRCRPIQDRTEAMARLKQLAMKYFIDEGEADETMAKYGKGAQVYSIEIEHMTGKEIQEK